MPERIRKTAAMLWCLVWPLLVYETVSAVFVLLCEAWLGIVPGEFYLSLRGAAAFVTAVFLGAEYRKLRRLGQSEKPLQAGGNFHMAPWSVLAGIGACIFANGILNLFSVHSKGFEEAGIALHHPGLVVQILCAGFLIPLAEELVFRGMGFCRLRQEMMFPAASLITAAYFGLFHGNLEQGIYAFFLGFFLALSLEWSGSLLIPWLFHVSANLLSVFLMAVGRKGQAVSGFISLFGWMFAGGLLFALSLYKMREVGKEYEITFHSDTML